MEKTLPFFLLAVKRNTIFSDGIRMESQILKKGEYFQA